MKSRCILSVIFLPIFIHNSIAQTSYTALNKTDKLAPIKIGMSMSVANSLQHTLGPIVQGCLFNKLFYSAEYKIGVFPGWSNIGFVSPDKVETSQTLKGSKYLDANVSFAFVDKMRKGSVRITLDKNYNTETYFNANCDIRKIIALDAGLFSNNYTYYLNSDSGEYFQSGNLKLSPTKDKYLHSNVSVNGIYGGISFRKIKKVAVSVGDYRHRNFRSRSWSFQAMLGTGNMQDINLNNKMYSVDNAKTSPLGYRLVFRADRGPINSFIEFGKQPHMVFNAGNNHADISLFGPDGLWSFVNYLRVGYNFILFGNDKRYKLME